MEDQEWVKAWRLAVAGGETELGLNVWREEEMRRKADALRKVAAYAVANARVIGIEDPDPVEWRQEVMVEVPREATDCEPDRVLASFRSSVAGLDLESMCIYRCDRDGQPTDEEVSNSWMEPAVTAALERLRYDFDTGQLSIRGGDTTTKARSTP